MPKHPDALKSLIDQAYLIASADPMPEVVLESIRENLEAGRALVRQLLSGRDLSGNGTWKAPQQENSGARPKY